MNRATILFCAVSTAAVAQPIDHTPEIVLNETRETNFGKQILAIGDLNGDGIHDLAISAPGDDTNANNAGRIDLVSGADGALIDRVYGELGSELLGNQMFSIGDIDADGIADFAASSSEVAGLDYAAALKLYSGADATLIRTVIGPDVQGFSYGRSGAPLGDINADGHADFLVGSSLPFDFVVLGFPGQVEAISGADGSTLYTVSSPTPGDSFASAVASLGDINNDGAADIAVAAPFARPTGAVGVVGAAYVLSGIDGAIISSTTGPAGERIGAGIGAVSDLDNDGMADYAVTSTANAVIAISSLDGSTIWRRDADTVPSTRAVLTGVGDLDLDGVGDLVFGDYADGTMGYETGVVRVISGATGAFLPGYARFGSQPRTRLGITVAPVGDLNADSIADYAFASIPPTGFNLRPSVTIMLSTQDPFCNAADLAIPFGELTFADITAFLSAFAANDLAADLAAPLGAFTFADITAFLDAFAAGCP